MAILVLVLCLSSYALAQFPPGDEWPGGPPGEDDWPGSIPPGGGDNFGVTGCPRYGIFQAPDPESCSRFILCNNGLADTHNCAPGLQFNIDRGICIAREAANCDLCRFNRRPLRFFPVEGSCTRYTACFGRNRVDRECARGLYFNPATSQCDHRRNVVCTPTDYNEPTRQCPNSPEAEFFPSLQSCENYFVCASGQSSYHNCSDGLIFDITTSSCSTTGRCLLDYTPQCENNNEFLAHPYDCRHYFFCIKKKPILYTCSPGLLFDITARQCNVEEHATCATPPRDNVQVWPN